MYILKLLNSTRDLFSSVQIRIKKINLYLFLVSIFFFKIPSFYLLPFYKNNLLTTQAFARELLVFIFLSTILLTPIKYSNLTKKKIFVFIFLLFLVQSFSIIPANDTYSFISSYKDKIVGLLSFCLFFIYRKKYKTILLIFLISSLLNIIYQFVIYLNPLYSNFLLGFIYDKHAILVSENLNRGRIYIDSFDEIITPFVVVSSLNIKKNLSKRILYGILFILISFFSFISNWRIRVAMLLFATITGILLTAEKNRKIVFYLLFIALTCALVFEPLFQNKNMGSFFDRWNLTGENLNSIDARSKQFDLSFNSLGVSILGVGLGNYYLISNFYKLSNNGNFYFSNWQKDLMQRGANYLHNNFLEYFVESGVISLLIFMLISLNFVVYDIYFLRGNGNKNTKMFIISFWTLYLYGLFNPTIPGSFQFLFWGLRGLILVR